ncbi:MAG: hypothetical protein ACTSRB_02060 [Candidatus Helarchaeota archaeon]
MKKGVYLIIFLVAIWVILPIWSLQLNFPKNHASFLDLTILADTEPPNIISVERNVSYPEYYDFVNITVYITDNSSVSHVFIEYNHSSFIEQHEMYPLSGSQDNGTWWYVIPAFAYNTTISYRIKANDTSDVWNQSEIYTYIVNDTVAPEFDNFVYVPTLANVNYDDSVQVNVTINNPTNSSTLDSIILKFQNSSGWHDILASNVSSIWMATIPSHAYNEMVSFHFWANDTAGNENQTELKSYIVRDNIKPEIGLVLQNSTLPNYNEAINITVVGANEPERASGISSVKIFFSKNNGSWDAGYEMMNLSGRYEYVLSPDPNIRPYMTNMTYKIEVIDNAANLNVSTNSSFRIDDRISPDIGTITILNYIFDDGVVFNQNASIRHTPIEEPTGASGIREIWLNYSFDLNSWQSLYIYNATEIYTVRIPPQKFNTTVYYKIEIWDKNGNFNESTIMNYTVIDNISPSITGSITTDPGLNEINDTTQVNVTVGGVAPSAANASDIKDVRLRYINQTLNEWEEISINDTLWGLIPAQLPLSEVTFQIVVENYGGAQTTSVNYSYTVKTYRPLIIPTPPSPDNDGDIELSWAIPDSSLDIVFYRIYRATNASGPFMEIGFTQNRNENSFKDLGLADGTYWYRIRSVNASDLSDLIDPDYISPDVMIEVNDIVRPGQPRNVFLLITPTGVIVRWNSPGDTDIIKYRVYRSIFPWFHPSDQTLLVESSSTAIIDSNAVLFPMIYYYIIEACDEKGVGVQSEMSVVVVPNLPLYLIFGSIGLIGSITVAWRITTYREQQKKLEKQFKKEKKQFLANFDYQLSSLQKIISEIESSRERSHQIVDHFDFSSTNSQKILKTYQDLKKFTGLYHLMNSVVEINEAMNARFENQKKKMKKDRFRKEFEFLEETWRHQFNNFLFTIGESLRTLRKDVSSVIGPPIKRSKIFLIKERKKFDLALFQNMLREKEREFELKYNDISKKLETMLIKKEISKIEEKIQDLEMIYMGTSAWLKNAKEFAIKLRLPASFGYLYQLNKVMQRYEHDHHKSEKQIAQLRTRVQEAVDLIRNFIRWNVVEIEELVRNHERQIINFVLKYVRIKNENIIMENIKEQIVTILSIIDNRNKKIKDYFHSNEAYPIKDQIREWNSLITRLINSIEEFNSEINTSLGLIRKFLEVIFGFHEYFSRYLSRINQFLTKIILKLRKDKKYVRINSLIDTNLKNIEKRIKSFENAIITVFNKPEITLGSQSMTWLFNEWEKLKKLLQDQFNKIRALKFKFKCEIMGEDLDPFKDEIWECTNCHARACNRHLERWFLTKQVPQCFKCGSIGSFKRKLFLEEKKGDIGEPAMNEWNELFSCPICRKPLIIDSAKFSDEENLEVKTHCLSHPQTRTFILPISLESEWNWILKERLLECDICGQKIKSFKEETTSKGLMLKFECPNHPKTHEIRKPISKKILSYLK